MLLESHMHSSAQGCRGERERLWTLRCPGALGMDGAGAPCHCRHIVLLGPMIDVEEEVEDTNDMI